jgi:hypothetical protein
MKEGLEQIKDAYDQFVFIIADRLQMNNEMYNREKSQRQIYRYWAKEPTEAYTQRSNWITRVNKKLKINRNRYEILSMDDIADKETFLILKKVYLLYSLDDKFRSTITNEARMTVARRSGCLNYDIALEMSRVYLLEEIALNIRVRAKLYLMDEYYLGPQQAILPQLFSGKFSWFFAEAKLAPNYPHLRARFFYWGEEGRWHQFETPDAE